MRKSILIILLFCSVVTITAKKSDTLIFEAEMVGFCDNMEYFNGYKPGELLLGTNLRSRLGYSSSDRFKASAGILLNRTTADLNGKVLARPLFLLQYHKGSFTLNLGDIYTPNQHNLPDALLEKESRYMQPFEEGIQFIYDFPALYGDLWLHYIALNTKEHLEHLNLGLYLASPQKAIQAKGGLLWDHYGGQLHSIEGDYMRDSLNLFIASRFEKNTNNAISSFGGELGALGSSVTRSRSQEPYQRGYGIYSSFFMNFHRFELSLQLFKGNNYKTSRGNKLYEADDFYYFIQIEREQSIADKVSIEWGVTFEFVDIKPQEFFEDTEYRAWVLISTGFTGNIFPFIKRKP